MSAALVSAQSRQVAQRPATAQNAVARSQAAPQTSASKPESAAPGADAATQRALIDQYCIGCHNEKAKVANLLLDKLDVPHLGDHAEIGEKVVRKLRAGMMPPTGARR